MQKRLFLALVMSSSIAIADEVKTQSELALLPPYCSGTQTIRNISKDPKPYEEYLSLYGNTYSHLHHYCWALNTENNAWKTSDRYLRKSKLGYALGDIQYVLDRAEPGFVFLPDIYNARARILFSLQRDAEAVTALKKAIELKPDFVTPIARLSDYYVDRGDKARAIKTLEEGIDNTENAKTLLKKLKKLGKTYQGTPGHARQKETPIEEPPATIAIPPNQEMNSGATASDNPEASATPVETTSQTPPISGDSKPPNNPYCRFCP